MDSSNVSELKIIQQSSDALAKDLDRPLYYTSKDRDPRPLVRDLRGPRPLARGPRPLVRGLRPLVRGPRPLVWGPRASGGLIVEANQVIVNTRLQTRAGSRPGPKGLQIIKEA